MIHKLFSTFSLGILGIDVRYWSHLLCGDADGWRNLKFSLCRCAFNPVVFSQPIFGCHRLYRQWDEPTWKTGWLYRKIQTKKLESSHTSFLWYSHPYCDCSFSRYRLLLACRELSIIDFLLKAKFLHLQEVSFKQAHLIGLSSKCALLSNTKQELSHNVQLYAHHQ